MKYLNLPASIVLITIVSLLLAPVAAFAKRSRKRAKFEPQRAQLRLDIYLGTAHMTGAVIDTPHVMQLTDDHRCYFHKQYGSIVMYCLNEKTLQIVHEGRVSCKANDSKFIQISDQKTEKTYRIVWQCVNAPQEV